MTEEEYRNKIDKTLIRYFDIEREVWSVDKTARIDYVLKCKDSGYLFGLEVKTKEIKRGSDIGKYLEQAQRYSKLKFNTKLGTQKIPIFISPAISDIYKEVKIDSYKLTKGVETFEPYHSISSKHSNVNSLVGWFGVGEIRKFEHKKIQYFSFIFKNIEIWKSHNEYGTKINENNYKNMLLLIK